MRNIVLFTSLMFFLLSSAFAGRNDTIDISSGDDNERGEDETTLEPNATLTPIPNTDSDSSFSTGSTQTYENSSTITSTVEPTPNSTICLMPMYSSIVSTIIVIFTCLILVIE